AERAGGASARGVRSAGVIRMSAKAAIANDAGIAKNNSAVEGVMILGEQNIPAASVSTLSARLAEGLSTWNDGVISVVNAPAAARGVKVGMTAKDAARLMLAGGAMKGAGFTALGVGWVGGPGSGGRHRVRRPTPAVW